MNERSLSKNRILCLILSLLLIVSVSIVNFSNARSARADVVTYSNVLDDLKKDENFKEEDHPSDNEDYSLKVITIAEGVNRELFIYVNNPSYAVKDYIATAITLSLSEAKDVDPSPYRLTFLNRSAQFQKYKVEGITVSSESTRYYFIVSILRAYDKKVDMVPPTGQTISEVSFGVGQEHTFKTENGVTTHTFQAKEVLKITDKYVGFLRYGVKKPWLYDAVDSHFVAFDTNWQIDDLLEVKLSFSVAKTICMWPDQETSEPSYSDIHSEFVTIKKDETGGGAVRGWWFKTYKYNWPRIQKFEDFAKSLDDSICVYKGALTNGFQSVEITNDELLAYKEDGDYRYNWILRFYDSDYAYNKDLAGSYDFSREEYTSVSNVVLLRMYFESDGKFYNLGVVDNIQTGSEKPTGETGPVNVELTDLGEKVLFVLQLLLGLTIIVLIVCLIWPFLPQIGNVIAKIILFIIKGIIKIISFLSIAFSKVISFLSTAFADLRLMLNVAKVVYTEKKPSEKEQESKDKNEKNEKKRR